MVPTEHSERNIHHDEGSVRWICVPFGDDRYLSVHFILERSHLTRLDRLLELVARHANLGENTLSAEECDIERRDILIVFFGKAVGRRAIEGVKRQSLHSS